MSRKQFATQSSLAAMAIALWASTPAAVFAQGKGEDEVIVTGVRSSLERALDLKKESVSFVDAITAEDVGRLPDRNIAEALQRVSGVTIQRNRGEGDFVSIRGLGPEFVRGTINGRTVVSVTDAFNSTLSGGATNQSGRETNFDVLPSEIINTLVVSKSESASDVEGGIGGVVDIKTARPLDLGNIYAGSVRGRYSEFADDVDFGGSGVASWVNDEGTFGALFTIAYSDRSIRNDIAEGFAYSPDSGFLGDTVYDTNGDGAGDANNPVFPFSSNLSSFDEQRERITLGATLQWVPDDSSDLTVDFLYTNRDLEHVEFQSIFLTQGGFVGENLGAANADGSIPFPSLVVDGDNNVVSYDVAIAEFPENLTDIQRGEDENIVVGANYTKDYGDWGFEADLSYSRADGGLEFRRAVYVPTFNYNASVSISDFINFQPDATSAALFSDASNFVTRNVDDNITNNTDEEFATRFDVSYGERLNFGVRYSNREKIVNRDAIGGTPEVTGLSLAQFTTISGRSDFLDGEFSGFDHGNLVFASDAEQLIDALEAANAPGARDRNFDPLNSYRVQESTFAGFVQLDLDGAVGSIPYVGNVGVRIVNTDQTVGGFSQPFEIQTVGVIGEIVFTSPDVQSIMFDDNYTEVLPSLNLRFELQDDLFFRIAASKSLTRAEFQDLAPGLNINATNLTANAGNPALTPYDSTNLDLGVEYYFADAGVLAGSVFYKGIDSFIAETTNQNVDILGTTFVTVVQPDNQGTAELFGVELSYQQPFGVIVSALEDFGTVINYTYVDNSAEFSDGQVLPFEGVSDHSFNAAAYYDNGRFDARVAYTYRSEFLLLSNDVFGQNVFQDDYGQFDVSASYDVTENFNVFATVLNITDANESAFSGNQSRPQIESKVGRRFELGVRVKF